MKKMLHHHFLYWAEGHDALIDRLTKHPESLAQLQQYIDACVCASMPFPQQMPGVQEPSLEQEADTCAKCGHDLAIDKRGYALARKYKRRPYEPRDPPFLHCSALNCDYTTSPNRRLKELLQKAWTKLDLSGEAPLTHETIAPLVWQGFPINPNPDDKYPELAAKIRLCCLLYVKSRHHPWHHPTCGKSCKARKTGCCRFRLPAPPSTTTDVRFETHELDPENDDDDKEVFNLIISLRRCLSSAWVNQCNLPLLQIFNSNNNYTYVRNCLVGLYTGMYASKST